MNVEAQELMFCREVSRGQFGPNLMGAFNHFWVTREGVDLAICCVAHLIVPMGQRVKLMLEANHFAPSPPPGAIPASVLVGKGKEVENRMGAPVVPVLFRIEIPFVCAGTYEFRLTYDDDRYGEVIAGGQFSVSILPSPLTTTTLPGGNVA